MSKTLVLAIALSLVLASGTLYSAQADCGCFHLPSLCSLNLNPCNWHFPSCSVCNSNVSHSRDTDRQMTKQHQLDQSNAVHSQGAAYQ